MSYDNAVSSHYSRGGLINAIEAALPALGKTTQTITIEDLAAVDEFHIGGRVATENLVGQLNFSEQNHVLDVGCGLGGASRYVANQYKSRVTGIDLTPEYIETGKVICGWLNLDKKITLKQGNALSMPFQDNMFDGGYMLHVGMNIDDKASLFSEIYRVLKSGAYFGIYDIMRQDAGALLYPVPWAANSSTSKLSTPEQYKAALINAGFEIRNENNRQNFALASLRQLRDKTAASGSPPPLSLHTLMQATTAEKVSNMIENMSANYMAPVEIIAKKI